jgi:hypothetical protein
MLALVLLVCGYHWRQVFSNEFSWLEAPGVLEHTLPLMQYQAGELDDGQFPLWDPYTDSGRPLIGFGKISPLYPPHLAMLAMPLKAGWLDQNVLHWYFVLIQCAMALSMFSLALALGQATPAAVLAACIFAFTGEAAASHQPHLMHAAVWVPLAFRALVRREAVWAGVWLGLCWWPGTWEIPLFATLGALLYARLQGFRWRACGGMISMSIAIGAIAILPGLQFFEPGMASFRIPDLTSETVSWISIALALLGLTASQHRTMALVGTAGLVTSPLGGGILFHLALAAGAGWGVELVVNHRWKRWIARILVACGVLFLYLSTVGWALRWKNIETTTPALLGFLALALALLLYKGRPRTASWIALVLLLLDLSQANALRWRSRFDKERPRKLTALASDSDLARFLRTKTARAVLDRRVMSYDFGPWWKIETHSAVDPRWNASLWISNTPHPELPERIFFGSHGVHVYASSKSVAQSRPHLLQCSGKAREKRFTNSSIELEVISACEQALLLTGVRYSPGWTAESDGKNIRTERTSNGELAVETGKGVRRIQIRFRPIGLLVGAAFTCLGLVVAFVLAWRRRINYS